MVGLTVLGLMAGGLTTASFVPQVGKIWKTKSAEDVSLLMFVAFCVGVSLWLVYGFIKGEVRHRRDQRRDARPRGGDRVDEAQVRVSAIRRDRRNTVSGGR